MSCRTNRVSSGITSFARAGSDLGDGQTLSLFHQLMSSEAARSAPNPQPAAVQEWLSSFASLVQHNDSVSASQRQRVLERVQRLDSATMPTGPMFHAWQEMGSTAQASSQVIERAYQNLAGSLGLDRAELQARIQELEQTYQARPQRRTRPADADAILERIRSLASDNGNSTLTATTNPLLPRDPTTLAVWSQLIADADRRRTDTHTDTTANLTAAAPSAPNNVPAVVETSANFQPTHSPTASAASTRRCPNCGQFLESESESSGTAHVCPTPILEEVTGTEAATPIAASSNSRRDQTESETARTEAGGGGVVASPLLPQPSLQSPPPPPPPPPPPANPRWLGRANVVRDAVSGRRLSDLIALRRQILVEAQQAQAKPEIAAFVFRNAPKLAGTAAGELTFNQWVTELKAARSANNPLTSSSSEVTSESSGGGSGGGSQNTTTAPALPYYETEQVLGSAATNFGVELEFRTADANLLARKLYDAGLAVHPQMVGYHHTCAECQAAGLSKWKVERDGSVTQLMSDGRSLGGEVVSPILSDTPADWEALRTVSEAITELGGTVDHNTGQHVHVSTASYQNESEPYRKLASMVAQHEDLLYRLSAPDVEQHRGLLRTDHQPYHYAQPISRRVESLTRQPQPSLRDILEAMGVNERTSNGVPLAHYLSLNMQHINQNDATKSRVEFRTFNGTIDPVQIQTNVRLAAAFVYAASAPAQAVASSSTVTNTATSLTATATTVAEATPTFSRELGWHAQHRTQEEDSQHLRHFLDLLGCLSENGAKGVVDTFLRSKWQRRTRSRR